MIESMLPAFICLIAMGIAFTYVLSPVMVHKQDAQYSDLAEYRRLLFEKEMILLNLRDLESDFSMRKISDEDYQNLRERMLTEAEKIYKDLEQIITTQSFFIELDRDLSLKRKEAA